MIGSGGKWRFVRRAIRQSAGEGERLTRCKSDGLIQLANASQAEIDQETPSESHDASPEAAVRIGTIVVSKETLGFGPSAYSAIPRAIASLYWAAFLFLPRACASSTERVNVPGCSDTHLAPASPE